MFFFYRIEAHDAHDEECAGTVCVWRCKYNIAKARQAEKKIYKLLFNVFSHVVILDRLEYYNRLSDYHHHKQIKQCHSLILSKTITFTVT